MKGWEVIPAVLLLALVGSITSQDVVCGHGTTRHAVTLEKGSSFTYRTQEGPMYGKKVKCLTTIKRGGRRATKCQNISFSCSSFVVANKKPLCARGDKMVADKTKYCQTTGPNIISKKKKIKVNFLSKKNTKGAPGATCTIQCLNNNQLTTAPPTTTVPPITTTTTTSTSEAFEGEISIEQAWSQEPNGAERTALISA